MSENNVFISLADLAATDTTDIKVLRNRLQKPGIYILRMTDAEMKEVEDGTGDKEQRFSMAHGFDVLDFYPALEEDKEDAADMIGKRFMQFKPFFPKDFAEQIGLAKGMYQRAHLSVTGPVGGSSGIEGWFDRAVGSVIGIKVSHRDVKDDTRVYYDWLGAKALAALNIDWESEVGRTPVDQHDNELDLAELIG